RLPAAFHATGGGRQDVPAPGVHRRPGHAGLTALRNPRRASAEPARDALARPRGGWGGRPGTAARAPDPLALPARHPVFRTVARPGRRPLAPAAPARRRNLSIAWLGVYARTRGRNYRRAPDHGAVHLPGAKQGNNPA